MNQPPPHVPMPPPPPEVHPAGEWNNYSSYQDDPLVGTYDDVKPKKNRKATPIEKWFQGYILSPIPPRAGEKKSWHRVSRTPMHYDQKELLSSVRAHRKRTGTRPVHDLSRLTPVQQSIINRLVTGIKEGERDSNADWVLVDVQKTVDKYRTPVDVKEIRVILKRHDINLNRTLDRAVHPDLGGFQASEIIDLADPVAADGRKGKDKRLRRSGSREALHFENSLPLHESHQDQQHGQHGYAGQQTHYDRGMQQPQYHDSSGGGQHAGIPPPPPLPPQGAIPIEQYPAYPIDALPFEPQSNQFYPETMNNVTPWPQQAHTTARAPTQAAERRPSIRHRSSSAARNRSRREQERIDRQIDTQLNARLGALNLDRRRRDHSPDSPYSDPPSIFSQPSAGEAFTPPSTPPRSEYDPYDSLYPRHSRGRHGHRRSRDEDVDPRAAWNPRVADEYVSRPRRRTTRSILQQPLPVTPDDYPRDEGWSRHPRPQRRLMEAGQGYDIPAEFVDNHRRGRGQRGQMHEDRQPVYERRVRGERLFGEPRGEGDWLR